MPFETIQLTGHILDNHTLPNVLDLILAFGGDHTIESMDVGHSRNDESTATIKIKAKDRVIIFATSESVRHVEQMFRVSLEFF